MEYTAFFDIFSTVMADNGFPAFCGEEKSRRFHALTEHMLEINKSMNLTAIKDERGIVLRHYADSLTVEPFLPQNASLIDVGCGAGFPCLPLGICRPDLAITALDSTEKRIHYVRETAKMLEIPGFSAIAARAEEAGHNAAFREQFDVCTARAVAALPVLAELCLPFVRLGGTFIAMKAAKGAAELQEAARGIKRLGGEVIASHTVLLHGEAGDEARILVEIKKVRPTPAELPRPYAKICKKPL